MDGMHKKLVVRAFVGGEQASQCSCFIGAVAELLQVTENFEVCQLNVLQVKKKKMTPKCLVDWLLDCDVHMITSHLHQGTSSQNKLQMGWNMEELYTEVQRLENHPGYPSGEQLQCPVFTQNKYSYLEAIPSFVNPTLRIPIWETYEPYPRNDELYQKIINFARNNEEGDGWVVKLPYTTNKQFVKHCKSEDEIFQYLSLACADFGSRVNYAMLQPCMKNKKEYKVVYYNFGARYVSNINQKHDKERAFSSSPHSSLLTFADNAVEALVAANAAFLNDGIVRIDIFQTSNNKLVVNEFESLEAVIYGAGNRELHAREWLKNFWYHQLEQSMSLVLNVNFK